MPVASDTATNPLDPEPAELATDLSVRFLDAVFGVGWGQRLFNVAPASGSPGELLSTLFGAVNAVVVAGVAFLMLYTLIVGIIASAHEGTPLGRRYHTLWVPIRTVVGVALLMPLPWAKGLSVIQALIMLLGWHSIAGASYLSGLTLDFMRDKGGGVAVDSFNALDNAHDLATTLFPSLVAYTFFKEVDNYSMEEGNWQQPEKWLAARVGDRSALQGARAGEADPLGNVAKFDLLRSRQSEAWKELKVYEQPTAYTLLIPTPKSMPPGSLGRVRIYCPTPGLEGIGNEHAVAFCRGQVKAVNAMIDAMLSRSRTVVARHPFAKIKVVGPGRDGDPIAAGVIAYQSEMANARAQFLNGFYSNKGHYLAKVTDYLKAEGWLALGGWYWTIAGFNELAMRIGTQLPEAFPIQREAEVGVVNEVRPFLDAAYAIIRSDHGLSREQMRKLQETPAAKLVVQGVGGHDQAANRMKLVQDGMLAMFLDETFAHGDVLANLQAQGNLLLNMVMATLREPKNKNWTHLNGVATELLGEATAARAKKGISELSESDRSLLGELVDTLFMPLFLLGMFLAYYIPSIPFIVWALGFIGWLMVFLEAVVAAPLWAAAHAMPEGEGFVGQQGRAGYHLLMGILLRPSMMVIGFFLAIIVLNSVGQALVYLFRPFAEGMAVDYNLGPLVVIGIAAVFSVLMITVIHRVFGLIHWLPDRVMNWFGVPASGIGAAEVDQIRHGFTGAAHQLAHGGRSGRMLAAGGSRSMGASGAHAAAATDSSGSGGPLDTLARMGQGPAATTTSADFAPGESRPGEAGEAEAGSAQAGSPSSGPPAGGGSAQRGTPGSAGASGSPSAGGPPPAGGPAAGLGGSGTGAPGAAASTPDPSAQAGEGTTLSQEPADHYFATSHGGLDAGSGANPASSDQVGAASPIGSGSMQADHAFSASGTGSPAAAGVATGGGPADGANLQAASAAPMAPGLGGATVAPGAGGGFAAVSGGGTGPLAAAMPVTSASAAPAAGFVAAPGVAGAPEYAAGGLATLTPPGAPPISASADGSHSLAFATAGHGFSGGGLSGGGPGNLPGGGAGAGPAPGPIASQVRAAAAAGGLAPGGSPLPAGGSPAGGAVAAAPVTTPAAAAGQGDFSAV